ncbi:hypothetical protein P4O66_003479 [Electrophorus voltai]|uniref:VLIG-type G domain-containing protein n=1 Tax=Electrophorus voltai TaxID=2609070 RepID=A0AAD8YRN6_9TELE|nr:hypothetical protein P4O66_003479 [Electrophorus voltai]
MGQIYESSISFQMGQKEDKESKLFLPKLAAQLMMSGHKMELMDGDAAHVPVVWVSAVLDELIKILGDQRVFVLSVLGIQSSGKSTMLNAMFGLQFAVSAGRCTRGAFMQLVKVSEEMKSELNFDYIVVVDTEGLQSPELTRKSSRCHDNELATFAAVLGNMTLINIFGESPAEMQDILQITVHVFLRIKMLRLNPGCMFIFQNVPDVTAKEKNMEGRQRLKEKLDKMTKLAAQEEGCDAECFSDVIEFDVEEDVRYIAQLWEGSPPMAPLNPSYSENIEELKQTIISKAGQKGGIKLSDFKTRIIALWEALLSDNFVYSFRNTREIAVHRRLEEEYQKWTKSLKHAMSEIQNKLSTKINNWLHKVEYKDLQEEMKEPLEKVYKSLEHYFEENREERSILQQWREKFKENINDVFYALIIASPLTWPSWLLGDLHNNDKQLMLWGQAVRWGDLSISGASSVVTSPCQHKVDLTMAASTGVGAQITHAYVEKCIANDEIIGFHKIKDLVAIIISCTISKATVVIVAILCPPNVAIQVTKDHEQVFCRAQCDAIVQILPEQILLLLCASHLQSIRGEDLQLVDSNVNDSTQKAIRVVIYFGHTVRLVRADD